MYSEKWDTVSRLLLPLVPPLTAFPSPELSALAGVLAPVNFLKICFFILHEAFKGISKEEKGTTFAALHWHCLNE
jgi:hypothetical protein